MAHSGSDTASFATSATAHTPSTAGTVGTGSSSTTAVAASSSSLSNIDSKLKATGGDVVSAAPDDGDPLRTSRFYAFPPSFSLQPNLGSRASQLASWSRLVRRYCAWRRQFRLVVGEVAGAGAGGVSGEGLSSSSSSSSMAPLFHNTTIGRRLTRGEIMAVLEFMTSQSLSSSSTMGSTAATEGGGGGGGGGGSSGAGGGAAEWCSSEKTAAWIYWRRPEEWAELMAGWVEATGQRNVVLTLYELTQGENTSGQEFYGMPDELLKKVLQVLVKRGKAQVFGTSGEQGVKFF